MHSQGTSHEATINYDPNQIITSAAGKHYLGSFSLMPLGFNSRSVILTFALLSIMKFTIRTMMFKHKTTAIEWIIKISQLNLWNYKTFYMDINLRVTSTSPRFRQLSAIGGHGYTI